MKDLEKLVPLAERDGDAWLESFESEVDTTLEHLLLAVRTGLLTVSNDRLKRHGAAIFYRGRCVGCSYYGTENRSWIILKEAIAQLELDLRAPDTVISLSHLSVQFVVAIAAIYLGRAVECPASMLRSVFVSEASRFLAENRASATLLITEGDRVIGLTYYFRGTRISDYRFDGETLMVTDSNVIDHLPAETNVQLTAFIHVSDRLLDGFGIPMISPQIGGDDEPNKIGARKRYPKPGGESSIALELPRQNKDDDFSN